MRKTLIFTLVLCVVAVFAYAQTGTGSTGAGTGSTASSGSTGGTGSTTTGTTETPSKGKGKGKHGAAHKTYRGTVASVDQAGKSFVVHPAKGADVTLKVNDKTKYSPKGKTWDDVKVDAKVSGTYHNDGTDNWALTVHIAGPKAAPAAAKTTGK